MDIEAIEEDNLEDEKKIVKNKPGRKKVINENGKFLFDKVLLRHWLCF